MNHQPGHVPTLYIRGTQDMAVGAGPAERTGTYVSGSSYDFERLEGKSHWLIDEISEWIATRVLQHLSAARTRSAHPTATSGPQEKHAFHAVRPLHLTEICNAGRVA